MRRPSRCWILALGVSVACSYDKSELMGPPRVGYDGAVDHPLGGVDGNLALDGPIVGPDVGVGAGGVDGSAAGDAGVADVSIAGVIDAGKPDALDVAGAGGVAGTIGTQGQDGAVTTGGVGGVGGKTGTGGVLATGGMGARAGSIGTGGVGTGGITGSGGSTTPDASCIIPAAPTALSARRSGNKQVIVAWTNSTNGSVYKLRRSTTSGSGYQDVATIFGSPGVDNAATNTTAFYYVVSAASDANCPASAISVQVSVPVCKVLSGGGAHQKQNDSTEWCLVTCDDVQWWSYSGLGDRTLYINNVQTTTVGALPLPAKSNGGYAFYFTASANGSGNYAYFPYGASAIHTCP